MSDPILSLQAAIKSFLAAKEFFSDAGSDSPVPIPIAIEDVGDLEAESSKALDQAGGLFVFVRMASGEIKHGDNPVPVYEPALIHLRIWENPTINRGATGTKIPGGMVADAIIRLLWTFNESVPGYNPLVARGRSYGVEKDGTPYHDVFFHITIALPATEPVRKFPLTDDDGTPLTDDDDTPFIG